MKTISEILQLSASYLQKHGIAHAKRQAEELLCDALEVKRVQLYTDFDRPLNPEELHRCRSYLERRRKGEPLPYIHGSVQFYHCLIKVTPAVLIPRQETEILVANIIKALSKHDVRGLTLWDVCCGSGCIGIAIKKALPELNVILSDISEEALKVAEINASLNHVQVECRQGDLLSPFKNQKTNVLVCNPPYISKEEFHCLSHEVKQYEPFQALVGGQTGLEMYQRLAAAVPHYLQPGGKMWLEIGKSQGKAMQTLFSHTPKKTVHVESDWAGHDRFFFLEIQ